MNFLNLPPGCSLAALDSMWVEDDELASLLDDEVLESLFAPESDPGDDQDDGGAFDANDY